jgi:hypothetical protein
MLTRPARRGHSFEVSILVGDWRKPSTPCLWAGGGSDLARELVVGPTFANSLWLRRTNQKIEQLGQPDHSPVSVNCSLGQIDDGSGLSKPMSSAC